MALLFLFLFCLFRFRPRAELANDTDNEKASSRSHPRPGDGTSAGRHHQPLPSPLFSQVPARFGESVETFEGGEDPFAAPGVHGLGIEQNTSPVSTSTARGIAALGMEGRGEGETRSERDLGPFADSRETVVGETFFDAIEGVRDVPRRRA